MSLLPQQMADFVSRQSFLPPSSQITPPPANMLTPELLKAATASYGLFTSLFSHSQKKPTLASSLALSNSNRPSAFTRSCRGSGISKKSSNFHFRRGTRVRLADGSVQKVEALRAVDFIRAAEATENQSNLQWVEVDKIVKEEFPQNSQRGLVTIRFALNLNKFHDGLGHPLPFLPPITFDYVCNADRPFFVQFHGWSSCDPQGTQNRLGLLCRSLAIGDPCLVIVPPEIAKIIPASSKTQLADFKSLLNPLLFSAKMKDLFLNLPNCLNLSTSSEVDSVDPQQPLDLKKEGMKSSRGNVPEYFSAVSLAESPFKKAH